MDDADRVGVVQGLGEIVNDLHSLAQVEAFLGDGVVEREGCGERGRFSLTPGPSPGGRGEGGALDELGREIVIRAVEAGGEDGDDVRMTQLGGGSRLALEALPGFWRTERVSVRDLDGDPAFELGVVAKEDLAERAFAEQGANGEAADLGRQRALTPGPFPRRRGETGLRRRGLAVDRGGGELGAVRFAGGLGIARRRGGEVLAAALATQHPPQQMLRRRQRLLTMRTLQLNRHGRALD